MWANSRRIDIRGQRRILFQPMRPARDVTVLSARHETLSPVSIPAPRMGRGALRETNRTCPLRFNPHVSRRRDCKLSARIAGDHDIRQMQHGMALFQSTRRVRRLSQISKFQSARPRGARRSSSSRQQASSEFQSTRSNASKGAIDVEIEQKYCVSIHAVYGGTTHSRIFAPSLFVHASRAGHDDWLQCPGPGCTFQPACLARGGSNGAAHWVCNREFQSTCPARGTTMSATALRPLAVGFTPCS